jgi:hypothetical protein
MIHEAGIPMKPDPTRDTDRFDAGGRAASGRQGNRAEGSREGLVLLLIALLFVANVVLYLCHHYGLTSLNDLRLHPEAGAQVLRVERG